MMEMANNLVDFALCVAIFGFIIGSASILMFIIIDKKNNKINGGK